MTHTCITAINYSITTAFVWYIYYCIIIVLCVVYRSNQFQLLSFKMPKILSTNTKLQQYYVEEFSNVVNSLKLMKKHNFIIFDCSKRGILSRSAKVKI